MSEEAIRLPALPTSQMNVDVWDSEVRGLHGANAAYYTADQMQEYARAAVLAERERAAAAASALAEGYDGGGIRPGPNHATVEFWYETEAQAVAAHGVILDLIRNEA